MQNKCIQEESPTDMTPRIHYEVSCHNQSNNVVPGRMCMCACVPKFAFLGKIFFFSSNFSFFFLFKMKVPDKSKALKKYMVLFSIVIVAIVVSTVLAGYVGTENVVKDIPTEVKNQVQTIPGMEHLETLSNQTDIAIVLKQSKLIIIMVFGYLLSLKKNNEYKT